MSAASAAFLTWRRLPPVRRAAILRALGDRLLSLRDELALIQAVETAMPIAYAMPAVAQAAAFFLYNAGWVERIGGDVVPAGTAAFDYTVEEPYGVVGALTPWNAALAGVSQVLAPVLAAGNTVVLKPSPLAPFTALRVAEVALEVGVPPGVINVVTGGPEAGAALIAHPGVAKLHFTGSPRTARLILAAAAPRILPVCLELGGKAPVLAFADADPLAVVRVALGAMVGVAGQGCAVPTRLLVDASISERAVTLLKGFVRRIAVGDPLSPHTQMGPLVSAAMCETVVSTVAKACCQQEAELIAGGARLDGPLADGYFVEPTIVRETSPLSSLTQEEIFGPVLSVSSFDNEEEVLARANEGPFGLAAYICTSDLRRAHRVGAAVDAGCVWINGPGPLEPMMPFGGMKSSGFGRLGGRAGIREFTRVRNIWVGLTESGAPV